MTQKKSSENMGILTPAPILPSTLVGEFEKLRLRDVLSGAVCCICERGLGEDGASLELIYTEGCVVPICSWPCAYLSKTHCFIKCRTCGAVGTIRKWNVPGGLSLGEYAFIMFVEDCKLHGEEDAWQALVKNAVRL